MTRNNKLKTTFKESCPLYDDSHLNKRIVDSLPNKAGFAYGEYFVHAALASAGLLIIFLSGLYDIFVSKSIIIIEKFATYDITNTSYILLLIGISLTSSALCYGIYCRMSE